ncbi:Fc.00g083880.m01.CDS01 [Cosmosporella sp. VM-42]
MSGFSYPSIYKLRQDPLHILGFGVAHICLLIIGFGIIAPRWLDILIPSKRRGEGKIPYAPNLVLGTEDYQQSDSAENGTSEVGASEVKAMIQIEKQRDSYFF